MASAKLTSDRLGVQERADTPPTALPMHFHDSYTLVKLKLRIFRVRSNDNKHRVSGGSNNLVYNRDSQKSSHECTSGRSPRRVIFPINDWNSEMPLKHGSSTDTNKSPRWWWFGRICSWEQSTLRDSYSVLWRRKKWTVVRQTSTAQIGWQQYAGIARVSCRRPALLPLNRASFKQNNPLLIRVVALGEDWIVYDRWRQLVETLREYEGAEHFPRGNCSVVQSIAPWVRANVAANMCVQQVASGTLSPHDRPHVIFQDTAWLQNVQLTMPVWKGLDFQAYSTPSVSHR